MPDLDLAAIDHLDNERVIRPAFFVYLDIEGEPIRATTFHQSVLFSGTGDPDLDGDTFVALDPRVVNVGDVTNQEGGSDTLTISLSGLLLPDADILNAIGDKSKWRGRTARLWMEVRDETYTAQGGVAPYYTGYMVSVQIIPSPERQTIELKIENYLALLTQASNRTYLSQRDYDSGDLSANATVGTGNAVTPGGGSVRANPGSPGRGWMYEN